MGFLSGYTPFKEAVFDEFSPAQVILSTNVNIKSDIKSESLLSFLKSPIEISSRKSTQARKIDKLLENLQAGDLLLVSELSRLGRSVSQIIRIVDNPIKKQVRLVAVRESIKINGKQDIQTKTMITMFGLFAEIERDLISERTKQGLQAARAKGKILGRPKGPGKSRLDDFKPEIEALLKNGSSKT